MEKLELINSIKELIKVNKNENIEINEAYLEYFTKEELEDIKTSLELRKKNFNKENHKYLDEIYEKTSK